MKLFKRVRAVEAAMEEPDTTPVLVWSSNEVSLTDEELQRVGVDCHVAVDVYVTGETADVDQWRTVERVSPVDGDLGAVFGRDGRRIGRVTSIDGGIFTIAYAAAGS